MLAGARPHAGLCRYRSPEVQTPTGLSGPPVWGRETEGWGRGPAWDRVVSRCLGRSQGGLLFVRSVTKLDMTLVTNLLGVPLVAEACKGWTFITGASRSGPAVLVPSLSPGPGVFECRGPSDSLTGVPRGPR